MDSAPLPFLGRREDSLGGCGVSEEFVGTTAGGARFVVLVGRSAVLRGLTAEMSSGMRVLPRFHIRDLGKWGTTVSA